MKILTTHRVAAVLGLATLTTLLSVACSSSDENAAPGPNVVGGAGGGAGDSGTGDAGGQGGNGGDGGTGGAGGSAGDAGTDASSEAGDAGNACSNAPTTPGGWLNAPSAADTFTVTLSSPQIGADGGVPPLP